MNGILLYRVDFKEQYFHGLKKSIYLYVIRKVWYIRYITNYPAPGDHFDTHMDDIIRYNEYITSDA